MGKGILVGIITGMWIYTLMNDTYDKFGSKTKEKDIWQLTVFTGVVNGFFYAVATGAFDS